MEPDMEDMDRIRMVGVVLVFFLVQFTATKTKIAAVTPAKVEVV